MDTFPLEFHHPHHKVRSFFRARSFFAGVIVTACIFLGLSALLIVLPSNRIAWGTQIAHYNVSYLTQEEALSRLRTAFGSPEPFSITVTTPNALWTVQSQELGQTYDFEKAVSIALSQSHSGTLLEKWAQRLEAFLQHENIPLTQKLDSQKVADWIAHRAQEIDEPGVRPHAVLKGSTITINEGQQGWILAQEPLQEEMLKLSETASISAQLDAIHTPLSADARIASQQRLEKLRPKSFEVVGEDSDRPLTLSASTFFPWLSLPYGIDTPSMNAGLTEFLKPYEREAQNAQWKLAANGKKLEVFTPHRTGRSANIENTREKIEHQLSAWEKDEGQAKEKLSLVFQETQPEQTLEKLNDLGIKERIGVGTSFYAHSIPNRIHNVGLTSSRLHTALVMPGEEFSFNATIGDISQATGYKTAYVIKDGMTQLGDGGGVCQVSTTLFRAVLNAGLPVTRWKAHSYRVSYYEQNSQPGYDATVYSPSTDFRFTNDTGKAIVVTSQADPTNQHMVVELWGTSDGRQSLLSDYKIENQRPAPETLFIDDPNLPRGTRKQIDWSAPGASTRFTYTVKNQDGSQRLQRQFVSNFRPWRAVFLVGTRD